jgi:hypothetical protein
MVDRLGRRRGLGGARKLGAQPGPGDEAITQNMWNVFILLGIIVLFVSVIGILDIIARRQERHDAHRP